MWTAHTFPYSLLPASSSAASDVPQTWFQLPWWQSLLLLFSDGITATMSHSRDSVTQFFQGNFPFSCTRPTLCPLSINAWSTQNFSFSLHEWDKFWNLAADILRHLSLDFHNSYHPGATCIDKTEEVFPKINQPKGNECNNLVLLDLFILLSEEFRSWEEEWSKGGEVCLSK